LDQLLIVIGSVVRAVKSHSSGKKPNFDPKPQKSRNDSSYSRNDSSYQLPISRFNKGEANKIFSDVKKFGTRIVVKNNVPECVLISPQVYRQMVEEYENAILSSEAEKRFSQNVEYTDHEDLMRKVCLTDSE